MNGGYDNKEGMSKLNARMEQIEVSNVKTGIFQLKCIMF